MPVAHPKYIDRRDAGRHLVPLLAKWKDAGAIVFALPRGGVPVAVEVAKALNAPLDLLYVRKIGAPLEPELALGAVVDGADPDVVLNEALIAQLGVSQAVLGEITARELREIERRRRSYGASTDDLAALLATRIVIAHAEPGGTLDAAQARWQAAGSAVELLTTPAG